MPNSSTVSRHPRGRSTLPAVVAFTLVGVISIAAWWHKHQHDDPGAFVESLTSQSSSGAWGANPGHGPSVNPLGAGPEGPIFNPEQILAAATGGAGGEVLADEPAGLPRFPGPGAQRQYGFRRHHADEIEEVAFWRIAGASLDEVADFYRRAAAAAGFVQVTPRRPNTPAQGTTPMILAFAPARPAAGHAAEMLTLAIDRDGQSVRVLLAFRYPMQRPR